MPAYYTYLICSLPMLHFGSRPPFHFEKLLKICQGFIPDNDIKMLKTVSVSGEYFYPGIQPTLQKWFTFDTTLRNELVKIRAARQRIESVKYLRQERYAEPYITHWAINAQRNPSILEAERMLDQARWQMLDELEIGHYFDLDFLIVYALKLLILERWERINTADNARILEETLLKV